MKKLFSLLSLLMLFAAWGGVLLAQEQTCEITGTITDEEGNVLPGVSVEATSPNLVGKATTMTDSLGLYRLRALSAGTYKVVFTLQGFKVKIQENVFLRTGQILSLNMTMAISAIEETVTVTAGSPLIDVKRSGISMNITKEMFNRVPRGRNFNSIVTLAPSVNYEPWLNGISVDGASGAENMFFVDGTDITSAYNGVNTLNAVFEHLEEVQVKQSGYEAEYGGSMGGVINVITRSGGNEFHGELTFYYTGNRSLQGNPRKELRLNPNDQTIAEYWNPPGKDVTGYWHQLEGGFTLGGYVIKDKLWFYGGFIPTYWTEDRTVTYLAPYNFTKTYNQTQNWPRIQAKLTAQPFQSLRLSASFVNDYYKWDKGLPSYYGTDNPNMLYDKMGRYTPDNTTSFRADYVASANLFFSLQGGHYYTNENVGMNDALKPTEPLWRFMTSNTGYAGIPTDLKHPSGWTNYSLNDLQVNNKTMRIRNSAAVDGTYYVDLAGEHAWKAGFQFARLDEDLDNTAPYDYVRLYWGRGWQAPTGEIVKGTYGYYEVRGRGKEDAYGTFAKAHSNRYAFFLQDSWTIAKKLTLNLGVRTEREEIPSFATAEQNIEIGKPGNYKPIIFDFKDKLSPRAGLSYDVFGDSSLKVFGSFGIYYDVLKLDMAEESFGGMKWASWYYTLDTYDFTKIGDGSGMGYPGTVWGRLDWRLPSYELVQPNMKPVGQTEFTLGAEKRLTEDISLRARGVWKHLNQTIEDIGFMTAAGEQYYMANPGSDWIRKEFSTYNPGYWEQPKAYRDYYAIDLSLEKRYAHNWMGGFSYTLSKLTGNYSGLASSDEYGRNNPNIERFFDLWFIMYDAHGKLSKGPLATDRTHQIKLWGSYTFNFGLTLGINAVATSGTPVSLELAFGGVQGYFPEGRANLGRTPFITREDLYAEYNLKLTKRFTVNFNANVTNVLNLATSTRIYQIYNQTNIYISDEAIMKGFNYQDLITSDVVLDPRYKMQMSFMDPWSGRLGVKLLF
jgi:outer membrane receptor protein involved in Fe transport